MIAQNWERTLCLCKNSDCSFLFMMSQFYQAVMTVNVCIKMLFFHVVVYPLGVWAGVWGAYQWGVPPGPPYLPQQPHSSHTTTGWWMPRRPSIGRSWQNADLEEWVLKNRCCGFNIFDRIHVYYVICSVKTSISNNIYLGFKFSWQI